MIVLLAWWLPGTVNAAPWQIQEQDITYFKNAISYVDRGQWGKFFPELKAIRDKTVKDLALWYYYTNSQPQDFFAISQFVNQHPDWPDKTLLQRQAEQALNSDVSPQRLSDWFTHNPPLTAKGMQYFAESILATGQASSGSINDVRKWLRRAWIDGNFTLLDERQFLTQHSNVLTQDDHHRRINRLLWNARIAQAQRMLYKADAGHKKLFDARIALQRNTHNVDSALRNVPVYLRQDEGLLYDRIQWRQRKRLDDGVQELLRSVPLKSHYPEHWWQVKHQKIRQLISEKKYPQAYQLASSHGLKSGEDFADAEWLAGWLALRFMHKPDIAYRHFYYLYHHVQYPVSLARAAYWAGRAASANSNHDIAKNWYKVAAKHNKTFYGLLAVAQFFPEQAASLSQERKVRITKSDQQHLQQNLLAKAAYILLRSNNNGLMARKFITQAIIAAKTAGEMELIGDLPMSFRRYELAVVAAKQASRQGILLPSSGFPTVSEAIGEPLARAWYLAIIRQESEFNPMARSPAGAIGYMQLMPATARHVAKEMGVGFDVRRLYNDPRYNVQLGSYYLEKMRRYYNNSLVLAIASYNAGPGNVNKWQRTFGPYRSRRTTDEAIDWIELIPFSETRNYVHRVLENMVIYSHIIGNKHQNLPDLLSY